MKFVRLIVFVAPIIVLPLACSKEYVPAKSVELSRYREMIASLNEEMSFERLTELNDYIDSELRAAMHEVFANKNDSATQVFYGSEGLTQDGKNAMRVIWHRYVPEKKINITVMTFWYQRIYGGWELSGGADAIRVRSYLGNGSSYDDPKDYVWMSYDVTGSDNRVFSLKPTMVLKEDGEKDEYVASEAAPQNCASCHYHTMYQTVSSSKLESMGGLPSYIHLSEGRDVPAEYKNPKETFFIIGL